MSADSKAVFLSYASQDADAARKIADTLRGAGVEVWFDQCELRGGDAWDQKIRKQIKECALFLPIVSANTQARREGYFRLEWHLAEDRTRLIAKGTPFLVPVVVDETGEGDAIVPEVFLTVQWTRLANGLPSPEFIEQMKRLIIAPPRAEGSGQMSSTFAKATEDKEVRSQRSEVHRQGGVMWLIAAMAMLAIGGGLYFALRPLPKEAGTPAASTAAAAKPPLDYASVAGSANADAKSIAVLPFENRSTEPDTAFFTDGVHEDILTHLALVRDLRVVSRTSVAQYRGTTKSIRQIGKELKVAYILEGGVQRAGKTVRVTGQLIRVATDEHVWAKQYDRDLTDIFAIQSELSQAIAAELKTTLSPTEKKQIERRPTESLAAYDLYLKAREISRDGSNYMRRGPDALLESAVQLDPTFVEAWVLLCSIYAATSGSAPAGDARLAKVERAIKQATALAPESPDVIQVVGDYHHYCLRDDVRAEEHYVRALKLEPNHAESLKQLGAVKRRLGQWTEMFVYVRRQLELEPDDVRSRTRYVAMLLAGRRYLEAEAEQRRIVAQRTDALGPAYHLAEIRFLATGSTREIEELFTRWGQTRGEVPELIALQQRWALQTGNLAEWNRLSNTRSDAAKKVRADPFRNFEYALMVATGGDLPAARALVANRAESLRRRIANGTESGDRGWKQLAEVEGLLGRREQALASAQKALELRPEKTNAFIGPTNRQALAFVHAWTGDKEAAITELARLLRTPHEDIPNVHDMKLNPRYTPLRGHPRFEALLRDPANNAPLF